MDERIDLTCHSDDEDLQKAIRASLSSSGSGGAGSGAACSSVGSGNGPTIDNGSSSDESRSPSSNISTSKRRLPQSSSEKRGHGKRPRRASTEKNGQPSSAKPPLFRLLSTSPSDRARTGSVSLEDLLSGDFQEALLSNYMIDMDLLVEAQPRLRSVPVVVVHGDKEDS